MLKLILSGKVLNKPICNENSSIVFEVLHQNVIRKKSEEIVKNQTKVMCIIPSSVGNEDVLLNLKKDKTVMITGLPKIATYDVNKREKKYQQICIIESLEY